LATGKVLVKTDKTDAFILVPGEALEVNTEEKGGIRKFQFDLNKELSWKDGILYFKDNSFDDVVSTLEMWYDVKIQYSATKSRKSIYTGQFNNASLKHVLESMSFALDFEYTLNKKDIKIMFNQTPK
jgi:ferric-dicitrate binding protein FerR (iron transport regulator)